MSVTIETATADATILRTEDAAGAVISVGTMIANATALQIWGASEQSGAYRQLYRPDGSASAITLAPSTSVGRIYAIPDEMFALPFVLIVSGTTNSTGIIGNVTFKS